MRSSVTVLLALAAVASACSHNASRPDATIVAETGAHIAQPLKPGDCVEARRRAALEPDLAVDKLPAPIEMKPAPFRGMPASALRKDGSAEIKIDVVIDTLGRADLKTFKVVKVSNRWFVENVRGFIGQWRFSPAELASCKVPRVYHFMVTFPPRSASR